MNELEVKKLVRERDGNCCTICSMTNDEHMTKYNRRLDVHRTDPGSPYTVEGSITVCKPCHAKLPKRGPDCPYPPSPYVSLRLPETILAIIDNIREHLADLRNKPVEKISRSEAANWAMKCVREEIIPKIYENYPDCG